MQWIILATLPFISALIGWLTNRLAIHMLFSPREEKRLLGIRYQGLIPRRQREIASKTGEIVATELLTSHTLKAEIQKIDLNPYLRQAADTLIYERMGPRLKKMPLVGSFLNDSMLGQVHKIALEEMTRQAEPIKARFANEAEQHLDVQRLVREKVEAFDLGQLEAVIHRLAGQEFRQIELLGGVIGFIVGLVQLGLMLLAQSVG
ncbi:MAG: DUF445 family protein [Verrucomicrobiota bacterium JB022]|nr:DUF445 family protein [Verrucomicrobiota bacterium JB022]